MPKKIAIDIKESVEFLKKKISNSKEKLKRDRIKTLLYIKEETFDFQSEIGKDLGRSEKTIRSWIQEYSENGYSGLRDIKKRGGNNTRTISYKAVRLVSKKVRRDPNDLGFSSFYELKFLLEKELEETIDYDALYSHCRRNHKKEFDSLRKLMKAKRGIKVISPRQNKQISKDFNELGI